MPDGSTRGYVGLEHLCDRLVDSAHKDEVALLSGRGRLPRPLYACDADPSEGA